MKHKYVTKKYLENFKHHVGEGTESIRFYDDKYFLKIIRKYLLDDEKIKTIESLDKLEHKYSVTPEFLLYDKTGIIGYAANNYLDYYFLNDLLSNDISVESKINFNERKRIMIELSNLLEFYRQKDFSYYDIHEKNILYKDNDIKVLDLDGGTFKEYEKPFIYDSHLKFANRKLSYLSICYLYNLTCDKFTDNYLFDDEKINTLLNYLPKKLRDFYYYAFSVDYKGYHDISENINLIDENIYNETKQILLKK